MYKIMMLDDEPSVLEYLPVAIDWRSLGIVKILPVSDVKEALRLMEAERPDILLVDIEMPEMNGLAFSAAAQKIHPQLRIAILSAFDRFDYARQAMNLGIRDYLLKPVDEEELVKLIRKLTEELSGQSASEFFLRMDLDALSGEKSEEEFRDAVEGYLTELRRFKMRQSERPEDFSIVKKVMQYTEEHYMEADLSLGDVAASAGISRTYFSKVFKELTGEGYWDYLTKFRMNKARDLLKNTDLVQSSICDMVGYSSEFHFSRKFKELEGVSPRKYRQKFRRSLPEEDFPES